MNPFFCLNIFTQENWIKSHLKPIFPLYRNDLFDFHDKLTDWGYRKAGYKYSTYTAVHFFNVLKSVMPNEINQKNNITFALLFQPEWLIAV